MSEAALQCTERVIEQCEGHYTAWSFRRRILFALKKPLVEELEFIKTFTLEAPKNYQLWQHRQVIVQHMKSSEVAANDLETTKIQLSSDAKNIHCWQYRQWLIRHFNLSTKSEMVYTEKLFSEDIYNNSAWNHRFFLIKSVKDFEERKDQILLEEFEKILTYLTESNQDNECFWNYLAALVNESPSALPIRTLIIPKLQEQIKSLKTNENYLYLRFLIRFDNNLNDQQEIIEKLKKLHPINGAFWTSLSQNSNLGIDQDL